MSGPKVIRTITREELLELAFKQQAIVDHLLKIWQAEVSDTDVESKSRFSRFLADRSLIAAAANTGRPEEILRCANLLVDSINHDIDQMRDVQYAKLARLKTQTRSLQFMSETVLRRCRSLNIDIPADQLKLLQQSTTGGTVDNEAVSRIAASLMDKINEQEKGEPSTELLNLTRSLMTDGGGPSATEELDRLGFEMRDPRIAIAEKQIAELSKLADSSVSQQLEQQLSALLESDANIGSNQFSLRMDALGMEISARVKAVRALDHIRRELAVVVAGAEATQDSIVCEATFNAIASAIEYGDEVLARKGLAEAQELLEAQRQLRAGHATRNAILNGLSQLGYTVQEGMGTLWAEKKRLLIENPQKPGIAVEMAGNSDSGRVQARVVALQGVERGSATDREIESGWCSDVQRLREALWAIGCQIEIERALPVGTQPLKVVPSERSADEVALLLRQQHREMRK